MFINDEELAYEEQPQSDIELDDDDFEGDVGDDLFTKDVGEAVLEEVNRKIGGRDGSNEDENRTETVDGND